MARDEPGAKLLFERELDSPSLMSPFIWKKKASPTARSDWVWGYVTTEYDPNEAGSVTVISAFRGTDEPKEALRLKGFEVLDGEPVTVGDWNGDGQNELIVVDWEGQLRAFGFGGRPLEGAESDPSGAKLVAHQPHVVDVDGDGQAELVFLSLDAPVAEAVSALSICRASGESLPGLPLALDPPAVSSMVVASTRSGQKRLVFVREDGSISAHDPVRRALYDVASISRDAAPRAVVAAADVDSDGEDEILLATGGDSLDMVSADPESPSREMVLEREYSAIVAVASGAGPGGGSVACAYDQAFHQFAFLRGGQASWVPHFADSPEQRLVSLSRGPALGKEGDVFVAVFFEPAREKDVERVFEKWATPEMRETVAGREPQQGAGDAERDLKRSLLVGQFGEEKAYEMLIRPAATELWLLDPGGRAIGREPVRMNGLHPFSEDDDARVLRPAVLYEPSRKALLVLAGVYEDAPEGGARVRMYEVPCS